MSEGTDVDYIIPILIEWLPLLLIFALLLLFARGRQGDYVKLITAQVEETRRQNHILERIAVALERDTASTR